MTQTHGRWTFCNSNLDISETRSFCPCRLAATSRADGIITALICILLNVCIRGLIPISPTARRAHSTNASPGHVGRLHLRHTRGYPNVCASQQLLREPTLRQLEPYNRNIHYAKRAQSIRLWSRNEINSSRMGRILSQMST